MAQDYDENWDDPPVKPESPTKYWKAPKLSTMYVWYSLEGERGARPVAPKKPVDLRDYDWEARNPAIPGIHKQEACFSYFTYRALDKSVKKIIIRQPFRTIAYSAEDVKRWIDDINELGFPCTLEKCGPMTLKVTIDLSNYETKEHVCSTLYLIRVLWENGRNLVPELYFKAMDANPEADKMIELQKAHKNQAGNKGGHSGVIYGNHAPNLTRDQILENLKQGLPLYKKGNCNTQGLWGRKPMKGYAI